MFLPYRCKNPPESMPWATYGLILANVGVFALTTGPFLIIRKSVVEEYGLKFTDVNALDALASLFLHGDIFHLLGNMWFLHIFGSSVEGRLRTPKFLLLYLVSGLAGDVLQLGVFGPLLADRPGIGASGAIMGLMGAALYMFPFARVGVFYGAFTFWGTTTWHLRWVALLYVATDVLQAFIAGHRSGVGNLAHLGGVAGGLGMALLLRAKRDEEQISGAKATLAETRDLSLLAVWELEQMAKANPADSLVALHWMAKSLREPGGPKPACRQMFFANLDRMACGQPPEPVASVLGGFTSSPGEVPPRPALQLAMRLESGPAPQLAIQLYEIVLRGGRASEQDLVLALMRGGILCENRLGNVPRAMAAYQEVLRRDPMGPFAAQARHRLDSLRAQGRA